MSPLVSSVGARLGEATPISARLLDAARELAARLVREAVWYEDRCTWLGDDLEPQDGAWNVVHRSVDGSLYSGTSGIALFLASASRAALEPGAARAAQGALRHAARDVESHDPTTRLGLYDGALGIAWASLEVGLTLNSEETFERGAQLADRLARDVRNGALPAGWDLVSGRAGTTVGLLAAASRLAAGDPRRQRLQEAAAITADALCAQAHRGPAGWSWGAEPEREGRVPGAVSGPGLCGLAHGASGAALALLALHAATEEARHRAAALETIRYERGWFDRARGGWPDLRGADAQGLIEGSPAPCPALWCHGAVGIGLVRLRAYTLTGDRGALAEAGAALAAARAAARHALAPQTAGTFAGNSSLCHGVAGTIDLLAWAAAALGVEEHAAEARDIAEALLARTAAADGEWTCGVPDGDTTPGLMLGLAGIGAVLLGVSLPVHERPVGLVV